MSKGRIDEAIEILRKISKVNKKPVDDKIFEKFRVSEHLLCNKFGM